MQISRFQLAVAVTIGSALVLIALLSLLLYTQGPRIRQVRFDIEPQTSAQTSGTVITLQFDRRVQANDYSQAIQILPDVDASYRVAQNEIYIRINENLAHASNYTIVVQPEIIDSTGRKMSETFVHEFETAPAGYAYVQRNYDNEDSESDSALDHVYINVPGEEKVSAFSHPQIGTMAANGRYVLVTTVEPTHDQLHTIDLTTREVREESMLISGRIRNVALTEASDIALFSILPDINSVSQAYFEAHANQVKSLDMRNGEVRNLTFGNDEPVRGTQITMDSSGQAALVRAPNTSFLVVSPFNDQEPVALGTFDDSFGISSVTGDILFRKGEEFVRYAPLDTSFTDFKLNTEGIVRGIERSSAQLFVSLLSTADSRTQRIVFFENFVDNEPRELWRSDPAREELLEQFRVSYDQSLLAIQTAPNDCQSDSLGAVSQCPQVKTTIYDTQSREIVEEVRGFDFVWLP